MKNKAHLSLTKELALLICERVSNGELATHVCIELGINWGSWWRFCKQDEELSSVYASSREQQCLVKVEEMLDIFDEEPPRDNFGKVDVGWVKWQRNRGEARKWYLSKMLPKLFGEKMNVDTQAILNLKVVDYKEE